MRMFTAHPASVGETYAQHMGMALSFSWRLVGAGLICFVHALFPFLFVTTASAVVGGLQRRMVTHRDRREPTGDAVLGSSGPRI